jgi:hypothetical protein
LEPKKMNLTNGQTKGKRTNHVSPWLTPLVIKSLSKGWKIWKHLKMEALCVLYKVLTPYVYKKCTQQPKEGH